MNCTIEWNVLSLPEWERRFASIRRANLLQSYDFARAVCPVYRQKAQWGLVRIDGAEAGLVQILEAGFFWNALHAVILDRGPLWFPGFGEADHVRAFFEAFNRLFPRRIGRRRRILPETADAGILPPGLVRREGPGYQTVWLDLEKPSETLRAGLQAGTRNKVNKGGKAGLSLHWDDTGKDVPDILRGYIMDKGLRGYDGPSPAVLRALAKTFAQDKKLLTGRATIENRTVASIFILMHGSSGTYQVGWTTDEGRKTAAHNFLLWESFQVLKEKGIKDLDLGGINDESAAGVKQFKEGFGGETTISAGFYG